MEDESRAKFVEKSRVVADEMDIERLKVSGYREEVYGQEVRVIPDVSRKALASLRFGQLPVSTGYDSRFVGFLQPGTQEWREYFSTRKVVEMPEFGGGKRVEVTSNINEKLHPEDIVHMPLNEVRLRWAAQGAPVDELKQEDVGRPPRRYELVNVLTDMFLIDKFAFPEAFLNSVKFMAITDPDQAAMKVQSYIRTRPGSELATVSVGKYARSKTWAKNSVNAHAARFPETVAACDAVVSGKKVSVHFPELPEYKAWFVVGPLVYMRELMSVFKICCSAGTEATMFALGTELTILDIDINNGETFECPTLYLHAGSHAGLPEQSSPLVGNCLSSDGRIQLEAYREYVEVVDVAGVSVGSAVRISSKYVLLSDHLIGKGEGVTVGGLSVYPERMLSKDLWLAKCVSDKEVAWPLRDAEVGESVIVCYRREDAFQFSPPLTVRSTDGRVLVTSKSQELLGGMSGGAMVALSDFSLLGVYEGVGAMTAMGAVFSQEMFTDVCSSDRLSEADHDQAVEVDGSLVSELREKGLTQYVRAATEAIDPVYSGVSHVGMGFSSQGKFVTTCDPDAGPLRVGRDSVPSTFEEVGKEQYVTKASNPSRGPLLYRKPTYGEKVFVLGKDDEGPYFSSRESRVVHIGLSARSFVIGPVDALSPLPFVGGLVVAMSDAAVLGQYVRHSVSDLLGEAGSCVTLMGSTALQVAHSEPAGVVLEKAFPMLHPGAWGEGVLEEVFTHSSTQLRVEGGYFNSGDLPLGFIGDSSVRVALGTRLRELGLSRDEWKSVVDKVLSVSCLAEKAESLGLASMVRVGPGVRLHHGSKAHADVLYALCGAVYLNETQDVWTSFLEFIGVLREEY